MVWKKAGKIAKNVGSLEQKRVSCQMSLDLVNSRLGDNDRANFAIWLTLLRQTWAEANKSEPLLMPSLKTKIAQGNKFDPSKLLSGNINIFSESYSVSRNNYENSASTLEISCRLTASDEADIIMARVSAFMSPEVAIEGHFIAHTFLSSSLDTHDNLERKSLEIIKIYSKLKSFLTIDSIAFLSQYCSWVSRQRLSYDTPLSPASDTDLLILSQFWAEIYKLALFANSSDLQGETLINDNIKSNNDFVLTQLGGEKITMTQDDAYCMVLPLYWIDFKKFGRVKNYLKVSSASSIREYNKGSISKLTPLPQPEHVLEVQRRKARELQSNAGISLPFFPSKDCIDKILNLLEFDHGEEGAKRIAQQSFQAFLLNNDIKEAIFWASLRAFIDINTAIHIGQPFRVFHPWGNIVILSEDGDAYVRHSCGAKISLTDFCSDFRPNPKGF